MSYKDNIINALADLRDLMAGGGKPELSDMLDYTFNVGTLGSAFKPIGLDVPIEANMALMQRAIGQQIGLESDNGFFYNNIEPQALEKLTGALLSPLIVTQSLSNPNEYNVVTNLLETKHNTKTDQDYKTNIVATLVKKPFEFDDEGKPKVILTKLHGRTNNDLNKIIHERVLFWDRSKTAPIERKLNLAVREPNYRPIPEITWNNILNDALRPSETINNDFGEQIADLYDAVLNKTEQQAEFDKKVENIRGEYLVTPARTPVPDAIAAINGVAGIHIDTSKPINLVDHKLRKMTGHLSSKQDASHVLSLQDSKDLLSAISNPVAIIRDPRGHNSLTVITQNKTVNNHPIVVSLHFGKDAFGVRSAVDYQGYNELATAYGLTNYEECLGAAVHFGNLLYFNEYKARNTLSDVGGGLAAIERISSLIADYQKKAPDMMILRPQDLADRVQTIQENNKLPTIEWNQKLLLEGNILSQERVDAALQALRRSNLRSNPANSSVVSFPTARQSTESVVSLENANASVVRKSPANRATDFSIADNVVDDGLSIDEKIEQVNSVLSDYLGEENLTRLKETGRLRIVPTHETPKAEGTYKDGVVTLVAGNLTKGTIIPTLLHEMGGHGGFQSLLPPNRYGDLMQNFHRLVDNGDPIALEAKDLAERNVATASKEYLPYYLTLQAKQPSGGFFSKIVSNVKAWAFESLGVPIQLNGQDMLALSERMMDKFINANDADIRLNGELLYSTASTATATATATAAPTATASPTATAPPETITNPYATSNDEYQENVYASPYDIIDIDSLPANEEQVVNGLVGSLTAETLDEIQSRPFGFDPMDGWEPVDDMFSARDFDYDPPDFGDYYDGGTPVATNSRIISTITPASSTASSKNFGVKSYAEPQPLDRQIPFTKGIVTAQYVKNGRKANADFQHIVVENPDTGDRIQLSFKNFSMDIPEHGDQIAMIRSLKAGDEIDFGNALALRDRNSKGKLMGALENADVFFFNAQAYDFKGNPTKNPALDFGVQITKRAPTPPSPAHTGASTSAVPIATAIAGGGTPPDDPSNPTATTVGLHKAKVLSIVRPETGKHTYSGLILETEDGRTITMNLDNTDRQQRDLPYFLKRNDEITFSGDFYKEEGLIPDHLKSAVGGEYGIKNFDLNSATRVVNGKVLDYDEATGTIALDRYMNKKGNQTYFKFDDPDFLKQGIADGNIVPGHEFEFKAELDMPQSINGKRTIVAKKATTETRPYVEDKWYLIQDVDDTNNETVLTLIDADNKVIKVSSVAFSNMIDEGRLEKGHAFELSSYELKDGDTMPRKFRLNNVGTHDIMRGEDFAERTLEGKISKLEKDGADYSMTLDLANGKQVTLHSSALGEMQQSGSIAVGHDISITSERLKDNSEILNTFKITNHSNSLELNSEDFNAPSSKSTPTPPENKSPSRTQEGGAELSPKNPAKEDDEEEELDEEELERRKKNKQNPQGNANKFVGGGSGGGAGGAVNASDAAGAVIGSGLALTGAAIGKVMTADLFFPFKYTARVINNAIENKFKDTAKLSIDNFNQAHPRSGNGGYGNTINALQGSFVPVVDYGNFADATFTDNDLQSLRGSLANLPSHVSPDPMLLAIQDEVINRTPTNTDIAAMRLHSHATKDGISTPQHEFDQVVTANLMIASGDNLWATLAYQDALGAIPAGSLSIADIDKRNKLSLAMQDRVDNFLENSSHLSQALNADTPLPSELKDLHKEDVKVFSELVKDAVSKNQIPTHDKNGNSYMELLDNLPFEINQSVELNNERKKTASPHSFQPDTLPDGGVYESVIQRKPTPFDKEVLELRESVAPLAINSSTNKAAVLDTTKNMIAMNDSALLFEGYSAKLGEISPTSLNPVDQIKRQYYKDKIAKATDSYMLNSEKFSNAATLHGDKTPPEIFNLYEGLNDKMKNNVKKAIDDKILPDTNKFGESISQKFTDISAKVTNVVNRISGFMSRLGGGSPAP